jgi:NIMA (never in mitosis gene a)-related kinase
MSINDFEIIKELGKGAFSTVSLVKRKQDNKIYALKCVQISKISIHERQNSLNEVRLLASINHKNIISYKESFYNEVNQTLNIILEYADDGDLQTKINSKKNSESIFEEKTIWSIFIQMVRGLNELHKRKIVHRDLKSANIFLMKNGLCKLGDLNVAKVVKNELLRTQTGTPYFASPEIWEDKPYSFKSDIWSIGCILYQMAALEMPFRGKNIKEVYYNLKNINIPPIPEIYSKELMIMIKKLLKLEPELRPSTQEILDDDIIKNKMKITFEDDNELMNISLDINNFDKFSNNNRLINSIRIHDYKNLNYILPKKNYEENDKLNDLENNKDKEINIIFSDRNNIHIFDDLKGYEPIIKQNFSFH